MSDPIVDVLESDVVKVRPWNPATDLAFVLDSWVKSSGDFPRASKRAWVLRELAREGRSVSIAEAEGVIVGWACTAPGLIAYVYTKLSYRGLGVATALLRGRYGTKQVVQHMPRGGTLPEGWVYDRWV